MKRIFILGIAAFLVFCNNILAQENISKADLQALEGYEHDMILLTDSMYNAPIPDTRAVYSQQLARALVKALKLENSFNYPFAKLSEKINILLPEDKSFRIFNWSVLNTEITLRYYGAIQMNTPQLKLYGLVDNSQELTKDEEDKLLTPGKWFGCLYYNLITQEVGGQKIYTLFGLNKGNAISNKKILDPLVFTKDGPVFGALIFNMGNSGFTTHNRFIMEYKKEVQASMNWDKDINAIFFDRLISQVNDPNRKYTFVPSGQYDGFKWSRDKWNFIEDLIPIQKMKDGDAPAPQPVRGK